MENWDWTMIVGIFLICQFIFSIYSHCVIKFNDFAHTTKKLDQICENVIDISERVAYLEGTKGIKFQRKRKSKASIDKVKK